MSHRGPDDDGVKILEEDGVALGHTRLAIIDLTDDGHQPMQQRAGGPSIVFNGEIFNYKEIRDELEALGVVFNSHSDTEVLLAAYDQWSHDMLSKLIGQFAFALWDPALGEMFVVRDRLGIKPLYYYTNRGKFVCCSELKSLFPFPSFSPRIDHQAVEGYLSLGYVAAPKTIFQDVFKLRPGHYLRVKRGEIKELRSYWNPLVFYNDESASGSESEVLQHLDNLLLSSVRYRMISDVPLGALLSGGIDSSLIVALAQEQSLTPIKTFTIAFDEKRYDESKDARAVAEYLGTDHHELMIHDDQLLDIVTQLPNNFDEPFADVSAIPTYAVSCMTRKHVKVALSGDGGDETHAGYRTYDWMIAREKTRRILNLATTPVSSLLKRLPQKRIQRLGKYIHYQNPADAQAWLVSHWDCRSTMELLRTPALEKAISTPYHEVFGQLENCALVQRMTAADLSTYMVDDVLTKIDRASMAFALEVRVPLLDHRVVEYSAGLPINIKRKGGQGKYLLRQLLYKRVPQELVDRPKQGFNVPINQWLRHGLRDLLLDSLSPSSLKKHELFQENVVSGYLAEHLEGKADHGTRLWNLLTFQLWYNHYLG